MEYIFKFIKHISFAGWILYLVKVIIFDYIPDRLYNCIWVIIFTMIFYLTGIFENWWIKR